MAIRRWQSSTEALEVLLGEMSEAVMVLSDDGQVLYASPASQCLLGETMVGAPASKVAAAMHAEDAGIVEEMRRQLLRHPSRPYHGQVRVANTNGSWRHLRVTAVNRLQDRRVRGLVAVFAISKDTTTNQKLEENSRELALLQERERIAMDLHDGIIQSLYALGMSMGAIRLENERASRPLPRSVQDTAERVNEMIDDLRAYISRLQRGTEQRSDLSFDLRSLAEEARTVSPAKVEAKIEAGLGDGIVGDLAANLVAIAHEALSNALRHAGAEHIWLEAGRSHNGIDLLVADDGRGFQPAGTGRRTSDGLWNMRRRADAIGAYLTIRSTPGRGARVWVRLGLPPAG